jgi:hypothetical protein
MENKSVISESFKAIQTALEALEPLDATQREFALSMILKGLGMSESAGFNGQKGPAQGGSNVAQTDIRATTPKDFLKAKKPRTDLERVICLAYFLSHERDMPHFKTEDITALNTEAAGAKFANASATVRNAVSQSGFLSHAGAAKKQLAPLGEEVVEALPDREAVAQLIADAPKRRKPRNKPKARKHTKAGA